MGIQYTVEIVLILAEYPEILIKLLKETSVFCLYCPWHILEESIWKLFVEEPSDPLGLMWVKHPTDVSRMEKHLENHYLNSPETNKYRHW